MTPRPPQMYTHIIFTKCLQNALAGWAHNSIQELESSLGLPTFCAPERESSLGLLTFCAPARESSLGLLQSLGKTLLTFCAKLLYTGILQCLGEKLLPFMVAHFLRHVPPCIPGTFVCHGQPVLCMCLLMTSRVAGDAFPSPPPKIGDLPLCIQA